jgi:hypothetical protein
MLEGRGYRLLAARSARAAISIAGGSSRTWSCSTPSSGATHPLPAGMDSLVLDSLSRDPARRPDTANAFAARLVALRPDGRWDERRAREWWERYEPDCIRS